MTEIRKPSEPIVPKLSYCNFSVFFRVFFCRWLCYIGSEGERKKRKQTIEFVVYTGTVIGRVVGYQRKAEKLGSLTFTEMDKYDMLLKLNTVKKAENENV